MKKNEIRIDGDVCHMLVKGGKTFQFDLADLPKVVDSRWCNENGYCTTGRYNDTGKRARLHNIIASPPEGYVVDHIDLDRGNCRRENLRVVSSFWNNQNRSLYRKSVTGFRGVTERGNSYLMQVRCGELAFAAQYKSKFAASLTYDINALVFRGIVGQPRTSLNHPHLMPVYVRMMIDGRSGKISEQEWTTILATELQRLRLTQSERGQ